MYKIIGADGKEYGPVSATQLHQWIAEKRATAATLAAIEGSDEWKPLGSCPEFSLALRAAAPTLPPVSGRKTSSLALTSAILGVLSLTCCFCQCLPINLAGMVLAIIALVQIERNPERYDGKALAIIGLVLCTLSFVMMLLLAFGSTTGHWRALRHIRRL